MTLAGAEPRTIVRMNLGDRDGDRGAARSQKPKRWHRDLAGQEGSGPRDSLVTQEAGLGFPLGRRSAPSPTSGLWAGTGTRTGRAPGGPARSASVAGEALPVVSEAAPTGTCEWCRLRPRGAVSCGWWRGHHGWEKPGESGGEARAGARAASGACARVRAAGTSPG